MVVGRVTRAELVIDGEQPQCFGLVRGEPFVVDDVGYVERGGPLLYLRLMDGLLFEVLLEVLVGSGSLGAIAPSKLRAVLAEQDLPLASVL